MLLDCRHHSFRRTSATLLILLILSLAVYFFANYRLLLTQINQLSVEVEWRIQRWDWSDTPEEVFCHASHDALSKQSIPNVAHFIMLADEGQLAEFTFARYLAVKAAVIRMKASEVKIHAYGLNTDNAWWQQLRDHVTLVTLDRHALNISYGPPMSEIRLPHQADLIRLDILMRQGGIYLDTDVYALKPFTDLLDNPRDAVMGHEGGNRYGLCNAVIIARQGSEFIGKWQDTYNSFNPKVWNKHSVRQPKLLQVQFPDLICPLSPTTFFWPTWAKAHLHYMHRTVDADEASELRANMTAYEGAMYENQLAYHAVASGDYLSQLTPDSIQRDDTRFNILVRDIAAAPL